MSKQTANIPWFASSRTVGTLLLIAAVGILFQIAGGADEYPTIPPGALILGGAGLILLFVPWRWTIVLGLLVSAFITIGGVQAQEFMDRLGMPDQFVAFFGTWLQTITTLLALVGSILGIVYAATTPKAPKAA